ncbi:universal stress protein [Methylobacterium mesophilicum]|uniref:universal stress protein n=1 Tax=Methylobacterium mesophilicum TaxID=39956 RepID=UPI002F3142D5
MSVPSPLAAFRDILVAVTEEGRGDEPEAGLAYGLTLAATAGAHLTVQSAARRLTMAGGVGLGFVRSLVADGNWRSRVRARVLAERVARDAAAAGVICTTEVPALAYPDLIARITARSRLADLTVLDAETREIDLDRALIDGLMIESGRPLIVVPAARSAFGTGRIVVAWDGSAQAARAANDALPFLRAAEAVEIVSVVGETDLPTSAAGADFAPHLARHGVAVSVSVLPVVGDVAETLRTRVGLFRADMLVMGAYRHSRLHEWCLGGVTRSLLARSSVPLFLAH